jgi:hypothetical protein
MRRPLLGSQELLDLQHQCLVALFSRFQIRLQEPHVRPTQVRNTLAQLPHLVAMLLLLGPELRLQLILPHAVPHAVLLLQGLLLIEPLLVRVQLRPQLAHRTVARRHLRLQLRRPGNEPASVLALALGRRLSCELTLGLRELEVERFDRIREARSLRHVGIRKR